MCHFDTQEEPIIGVREITPVRLPMQRDVVIVRDLQQLFEIARLAHQPVRVVRQDVTNASLAGFREQSIPPRALPLSLSG